LTFDKFEKIEKAFYRWVSFENGLRWKAVPREEKDRDGKVIKTNYEVNRGAHFLAKCDSLEEAEDIAKDLNDGVATMLASEFCRFKDIINEV